MTRSQAKELVELIESMQHEAAVEMVQSLVSPAEDELRFTIVCDGRVSEALVVEPQPRDVEARLVDEVAQWFKRQPHAKSFNVYRSTFHGAYEPFVSARRK